jgi:hypothetical protein
MSSVLETGHNAESIQIFAPETHYPIVKEWWITHGWDPVPEIVLPKLGVIAFNKKEEPITAAWIYMDNSVGVSMLEWIVTNPANSPKDSLRGIKTVTIFLKDRAKEMGYQIMLATCRQKSLLKVLERTGFQQTDENIYHAITFL